MARKTKPKPASDVVGRVASALIECPLTSDEVRTLEKIERRRQEADADMRVALTPEQRTKAYDKAARAGQDAMALMERVGARREASWSVSALREIDQLAKLRGDDLEGENANPRVRKSPLVRLYLAELIDEAQYEAGKAYARNWQRLYGGKDGNGSVSGELDAIQSRIADLNRLDKARGYVVNLDGRRIVPEGLGGDARLVKVCDDVLGREMSLREYVLGNAAGEISARKGDGESDEQAKRRVSGQQRKVAMERLRRSLGLLALHYGFLRTREQELEAA